MLSVETDPIDLIGTANLNSNNLDMDMDNDFELECGRVQAGSGVSVVSVGNESQEEIAVFPASFPRSCNAEQVRVGKEGEKVKQMMLRRANVKMRNL